MKLLVLFVAQALAWAGVPALGAAAMGVAGALASDGELRLWSILVVGTLGAEVGGLAGWWIGNRLASAASDDRREGRFADRRRKTLRTGERAAERWGPLMVFLVPSWVAGGLRLPFRTFALWNAVASLLWNVAAGLGAYGLGSAVAGGSLLRSLLPIVLAVGAAVLIVRALVRRAR